MGSPFKVVGEIGLMTVSQRQMAAAIKLSTTRVNELINEGILIRDPSTAQGQLMLLESLQNYFLSKNGATDETVNFWSERAKHEKAKRELAELNLAQRRGEVYDAQEVEQEIAEWLTDFRNKLLGIGHKLAKQLEGKTAAAICDIIDNEITECLEELSRDVESAEYKAKDDDNAAGSAE